MDFTTPAPKPQAKIIVLCHSGLSPHGLRGASETPPGPDAAALPAACPCCGHRLAPYTQRMSNLLDVVLLLEAVVRDLKMAVEEVVL
jgi:hypothetical protein